MTGSKQKIRSMTGFASASAPLGEGQIVVDIKSINHRFLDVVVRSPNGFESCEGRVQQVVRENLLRGRVEVSVSRMATSKNESAPHFQKALFKSAYIELSDALKTTILDEEVRAKLITEMLLERREILSFDDTAEPIDRTMIEAPLDSALNNAIRQLVVMRETEGAALLIHLQSHLAGVAAFVDSIRPLTSESIQRFRQRVSERLKNADLTISEERLASEVALLADRTDVSEELERLSSHIAQFQQLLDSGGEAGKKLDFLTQEMAREINTTGSKSQHPQISRQVVEAKATVEKLREQIQNIE